jgi:hypothetical protein
VVPTGAMLCDPELKPACVKILRLKVDRVSRREPLPPLFMRFVMQAGFAWPALTPLTVDLLCKLIGKQARLAAIATNLAGFLTPLQPPCPCLPPLALLCRPCLPLFSEERCVVGKAMYERANVLSGWCIMPGDSTRACIPCNESLRMTLADAAPSSACLSPCSAVTYDPLPSPKSSHQDRVRRLKASLRQPGCRRLRVHMIEAT